MSTIGAVGVSGTSVGSASGAAVAGCITRQVLPANILSIDWLPALDSCGSTVIITGSSFAGTSRTASNDSVLIVNIIGASTGAFDADGALSSISSSSSLTSSKSFGVLSDFDGVDCLWVERSVGRE